MSVLIRDCRLYRNLEVLAKLKEAFVLSSNLSPALFAHAFPSPLLHHTALGIKCCIQTLRFPEGHVQRYLGPQNLLDCSIVNNQKVKHLTNPKWLSEDIEEKTNLICVLPIHSAGHFSDPKMYGDFSLPAGRQLIL